MRIDPASLTRENVIQDRKGKNTESSPVSFAEELKTKLHQVDQFQHQAEEAMKQGAVKGAENIHESMIKLEEADLSLRLLTKVRNKAIDAYQEIMRMQF